MKSPSANKTVERLPAATEVGPLLTDGDARVLENHAHHLRLQFISQRGDTIHHLQTDLPG